MRRLLRTPLPVHCLALLACLQAMLVAATAHAAADPSAEADPAAAWNLHGQATEVLQYHPSFPSPYQGTNSLGPGNNGRQTTDITLFAGARLWDGAALYVDPEVDQGFGLDGTLGVAGFPSGEAYKVGARNPYFRLPRLFVRQVIGGAGPEGPTAIADGPNQLAGMQGSDNLTITAGKFSVTDIFDTNAYAHDPRGDFLNWSVIDAGAFDYPADAWAFTYGAVAEWNIRAWTLRGGLFALSKLPNSKDIDGRFRQFGLVGELEHRHALLAQPGRIKVLGFLNRGDMGRYDDAIALARSQGGVPDTARVRHYASRPGASLNLEQDLGQGKGAFARASLNDGTQEAFEFTEINASLSAGISMGGQGWQRADDRAGMAFAVNRISSAARAYFADGGLGILIGDGQLPHYGHEKIAEAYYALRAGTGVTVSLDLQEIVNPAYNRDRGPVTLAALRLHGEF